MVSLNIPANNCAILQRGDDLELLSAGQHCITNPNVTLRGLYTLGENQLETSVKDLYVYDQSDCSNHSDEFSATLEIRSRLT